MRRLAANLRARWRSFVREADEVRDASIALSALIRSRATSDPRPTSAVPRLARPVAGGIGSRFGMRDGRLHEGVDFPRPVGTPVHPALAGVVLLAEARPGYGNVVVLAHAGNLATVYAHLDVIEVAVDEQVTAEQRLGAVGTTGRTFGPHLHFEVRFDGTAVDPTVFLDPESRRS